MAISTPEWTAALAERVGNLQSALGFATRLTGGEAAAPGAPGEFYWGGAGGTYFWVDPRTNLFVVFMMQSPKQRVPYRSVLRNMVYAAVDR